TSPRPPARPPPPPPPFPYTTLFRSPDLRHLQPTTAFLQLLAQVPIDEGVQHHAGGRRHLFKHAIHLLGRPHQGVDVLDRNDAVRSEEHTSELQSRENLVCRLLLEKK